MCYFVNFGDFVDNVDPDAIIGNPFHMGKKQDIVTQFIEWYDNERPHMSLDWDNLETPAKAFKCKMPPDGIAVIEEEKGKK